ncbi:type IV pilus secretin PilQ [Deltaproteobacteria bacterium IMCC39524]|nr:type IV pilus secretin PilQ [Deltaproteobacteria bacterium IMCC39524]
MLNQLRVSRTSRFMQVLFCCVVTFLMLSIPAWSADNNKLLAVSVDSGAATPTILVKTAEPVGYRYTVYDSFDPVRVVVDFPGMDMADMPETVSVNKSAVQEVRIAGFDLSSGKLTRVEILLAKSTEYQVNLNGKEFRIAFVADPDVAKVAEVAKAQEVKPTPSVAVDASQEANTLNNINLSPGQAILEANGKVGKFQYFALGNPPRLVVDLYGLKPGFKARSFPALTGFKGVRVGTYNDKTRLVFDASESMLPEHTVEGRSTDIIVSWGNDTAKTVAAAPVAMQEQTSDPAPAPVATPEVVAEKPLKPAPVMSGPVAVEAIDFLNEEGRSVIAVTLSGPVKVSDPVEEGNLIRFELVNTSISRALRRTIDASAFPSAVNSVTPYTVADGDHQNVRIAVDMKGPVAYALEKEGSTVRLVVDDGAYAEPVPAAVSQVEVVAPEATQTAPAAPAEMAQQGSAAVSTPVTADEMAVEAARYTGEKITLVFDSANVRSILQLIGDVSDLNILASSDVGGNVTLRLIDVPWDQALDLVLETAGLGKIQQGNVLRIMPKDKLREIEQSVMKEQTIAIEEGVLETKAFLISYASVDDMKGYLTDIKSDRGSIIADSRNKQLIVRDVADILDQMLDMITQIDKPERQVMIEARIVEANTNFSRNLGVKWNFDYDQNVDPTTKSLTVPSAALGLGGAVALAPTVGAGLGSTVAIAALDDQLNIDLRLQALENSGEGKIVSTPRITTLNGEKAVISQGTKIPFSTVSDSGTDVKFENAELKLEVTPEINPDGSILLDINVSNSAVGTVVPTATGDAVSIDEKKAQTKALVRDGQTTVIGGIFIEDERESATGVPILKDIPLLGNLFRSKSKSRDRRELLIFITPRIVE